MCVSRVLPCSELSPHQHISQSVAVTATCALAQRGKLSVWKRRRQHFRLERSPWAGRSRKEEEVITKKKTSPPPASPSHLQPHCSMEESSRTQDLRTLINTEAHFLNADVNSYQSKVEGGSVNQEALRVKGHVIDWEEIGIWRSVLSTLNPHSLDSNISQCISSGFPDNTNVHSYSSVLMPLFIL